eukprot:16216532-Heterocapsa_arctica.AAC.1
MSLNATPGLPSGCVSPRSRADTLTFVNGVARARAYYGSVLTLNLHGDDVSNVPVRPSVTTSRCRSPIGAN